MGLNSTIIGGRIPFDLELKNEGDEKKQFLAFSVSVQRKYKPEGAQFYPEDLIYCKAFRSHAGFIAKFFEKNSGIILQGELRKDEDYMKDGATVKGQMYFHVTNVDFPPKAGGSDSNQKKNSSNQKKTPSINPLLGKKSAKAFPF